MNNLFYNVLIKIQYLQSNYFEKGKKKIYFKRFFLNSKEHTKQTSEKSFHDNWIYIASKAQAQKLFCWFLDDWRSY